MRPLLPCLSPFRAQGLAATAHAPTARTPQGRTSGVLESSKDLPYPCLSVAPPGSAVASHQNQDVTRLSVSLGGHLCVRTQAADKQAICSLSVEDRSRAEQPQKSTSQQERLSSKPSTHQLSIMSNPMEKKSGEGKTVFAGDLKTLPPSGS